MEQEGDWARRVAAAVGRRVAHYRGEARLTAQALADRCSELGLTLDRSVIAKLEKGHRQTVSQAEVIVLAKALGVPPLLLIYPIGREGEVEVLPGVRRPAWEAAKWFSGDRPFPGPELGIGDAMPSYSADDLDAWKPGVEPLKQYDEHDNRAMDWAWEWSRALAVRDSIETAATDEDRKAAEAELEAIRLQEMNRLHEWREHRGEMRKSGFVPPRLPDYVKRRLGERDFVVYDRFDARGEYVERKTVDAYSEEDYRLAASMHESPASRWFWVDLPFGKRPSDWRKGEDELG